MSSQSPIAVASEPEVPAIKTRLAPQVKRLFGFIVPVNLSIYVVVGAVPGVLLPLQIQGIDEANKAANLAVVTGVGAFAAMIVSPIAGMISDRTHTRFGRRSPWILGGALASGLTLFGMGFASTVVHFVIAWTIMQICLNLMISPLTALLPDRIPSAVRGTFSTLVGIGMMVGILAGQILGARLASSIHSAYVILPGVMIVVVTLFVIFCKDVDSRDGVNEPFSFLVFLKTFWVNPVQHPDFFFGFVSRITLFTGYFIVTGFQLYLLQDYIGLGDGAVGLIPILGLITMVAMVVSMGLAGPLSDTIGRRKPFVAGAALLMGGSMIVPTFVPTVPGMMVFTAICSLGFGTYMSVDAALMSEVLPSEGSFAKDLGVLNIAATLPQTMGPFLGGIIVVAAGYRALFPVAVVLAIIGALSIVPIKTVK